MNVHAQADIELLRQYAESGSASAFATVVARHADFVFAVALRQTRSRELAEDVTQAVFIVLARRARGLRDGASVAGFLHQTTVFAAKNALRAETRRRRHEKQAAIDPAAADPSKQNEPMDEGAVAVDYALAQLRDGDRQFLMLHYFDGLNVNDLAIKLKISHEAARKRLHRALTRLRAHLTYAGTAPTAAALPAMIAALARPAASINASAVVSSVVAGGADGRAFHLANQMVAKMKLFFVTKMVVATAAVAAVAGSAAIAVQHFRLSRAGAPPAQLAAAASHPAASAPAQAAPPTVVDYSQVANNMREVRDERAVLEQMRTAIDDEIAARQAELAKLTAQRDAQPKDSAEYARHDQILKQTALITKAKNLQLRKDFESQEVMMMATALQKIEVAMAAVGARHHLQLSPAAKPAYPARVDLTNLNSFRLLCNKRMIPRPDGAPDLTDEVSAYLDAHPDIQVPGISPAPPAASTHPPASRRKYKPDNYLGLNLSILC